MLNRSFQYSDIVAAIKETERKKWKISAKRHESERTEKKFDCSIVCLCDVYTAFSAVTETKYNEIASLANIVIAIVQNIRIDQGRLVDSTGDEMHKINAWEINSFDRFSFRDFVCIAILPFDVIDDQILPFLWFNNSFSLSPYATRSFVLRSKQEQASAQMTESKNARKFIDSNRRGRLWKMRNTSNAVSVQMDEKIAQTRCRRWDFVINPTCVCASLACRCDCAFVSPLSVIQCFFASRTCRWASQKFIFNSTSFDACLSFRTRNSRNSRKWHLWSCFFRLDSFATCGFQLTLAAFVKYSAIRLVAASAECE